MGYSKPTVVKQEAQALNNGGIDPPSAIVKLQLKYGNDAPSAETYKRWRREDGWILWKTGTGLPATMKPDLKADVSQINDAILHLSTIAAKRAVIEHDSPSDPIKNTIRAVLWDVHQQLEPGAAVLSHLRKALRKFIEESRASTTSFVALKDEEHIETIMKEVEDDE